MSNPQDTRNAIAQGVIALTVCLGGYMALVESPRKKLAGVEGELEAIRTQLKEVEALREQVPVLTAARDKARADASTIASAGRLAREERDLFAAIMALADANRLTVEQMVPARINAKPAAPQASGNDKPQPRDVAVAYAMTVTGEYGAVAGLLRGVRTTLGHSVVRAVRLVPLEAGSAPLVRAMIETEHYSFDAAAPPAASPDGVRTAGAPEGH